MTLLQKQTFLSNYSYLTTHLIDIMESAGEANNEKRYKLAKNLVDTANEMYMYARMLEKEEDMAQQRLSLERADKLRAIDKLRKIRGDE